MSGFLGTGGYRWRGENATAAAIVDTDFTIRSQVDYSLIRTAVTNAPPNAQNIGALASGILYSTVTGGVSTVSIYSSAALSVIGRSANTVGAPADISATASSDAVLRESGGVLGFGTITTAGITNNAVTYGKIQQTSAASVLIGRGAGAGAGNVQEISLGASLSMTGTTLAVSVGAGLTAGTGITFVGGTAVTSNLSTGIAGGQTAYGGTAAGEALTLRGSSGTNGQIIVTGVASSTSMQIQTGSIVFSGADAAGQQIYTTTTHLNLGTAAAKDVAIFNDNNATNTLYLRTGGFVEMPRSLSAGGIVSAAVTSGRLALVAIGTGLGFSSGTLSNTGVITAAPGTNVTNSGTATSPVFNVATGAGLTAGTGITFVGGTAVSANISTGISGGQTIYGDTAASGSLTIRGSSGTNGPVRFTGVANSTSLDIQTGSIVMSGSDAAGQQLYTTTTHLNLGTAAAKDVNCFTDNNATNSLTLKSGGFVEMPRSLSAGGLVKAAVTSGRLSIATSGSDYVTSIAAGTGISNGGTAGAWVINNTGVLSVAMGTNITNSGTSTALTLNVATGAGLTAGTGITFVGGTAVTSNLSTGVSGGQTAYGGTAAADKLTLRGSSNASNGIVDITGVASSTSVEIHTGSIVFSGADAAGQQMYTTTTHLNMGTAAAKDLNFFNDNSATNSLTLKTGGAVQMPRSLSAGGLVYAAVTSGQLSLATVGAGLSFSGGALSCTVTGGITQLTGDVTAGPGSGSQVATIAANAVTDAKLRQGVARSVIGRSASTTGNVADISTSSGTGFPLRENGGTIDWGTLTTTAYGNGTVTYAKFQSTSAASVLIGRGSGSGSGSVQELTTVAPLTISGTTVVHDASGVTAATYLYPQSFVVDAKGHLTSVTGGNPTYAMQFGGYFPGIGTQVPVSIGHGQFDVGTTYDIEYKAPFGATKVFASFQSNLNTLNATLTVKMYLNGVALFTIGTLASATTGHASTSATTTIATDDRIMVVLSGPTGGGIDIRVALGFCSG